MASVTLEQKVTMTTPISGSSEFKTQRKFLHHIAQKLQGYYLSKQDSNAVIESLIDSMHAKDAELLQFLNSTINESNTWEYETWLSKWPTLTEGPAHDVACEQVTKVYELIDSVEELMSIFT